MNRPALPEELIALHPGRVALRAALRALLVLCVSLYLSEILLLWLSPTPQPDLAGGLRFLPSLLVAALVTYLILRRELRQADRIQRQLRTLFATARSTSVDDFLRNLARQLLRLTGQDAVLVGRLDATDHLQLLVVRSSSGPLEECTLPATSALFAQVLAFGRYAIFRGLRRQHGDSPLVQRWGADAFLGVSLAASGGHPIGLIAVTHRQRIWPRRPLLELLQIVSSWAATELEHLEQGGHAREPLRRALLRELGHAARTPLTAIGGYAELLQQGRLEGERQQSALATLAEASGRLDAALDLMQRVQRLESAPAPPSAFGLRSLLVELLPSWNARGPGRLTLVADHDPPLLAPREDLALGLQLLCAPLAGLAVPQTLQLDSTAQTVTLRIPTPAVPTTAEMAARRAFALHLIMCSGGRCDASLPGATSLSIAWPKAQCTASEPVSPGGPTP